MTKSPKDERPRSQLDWDDLRIFAAVADAQSVNKAARRLRVGPAAVSRRIDELEKRLNVTLFNRSPTGMTLTAAGEMARDRALSIQHHTEALESSVRGLDQREEGLVSIAAPDGVAGYWIAPRLPDFLNQNPKIQVALDCGFWPNESSDSRPDLSISAQKTTARVGDAISPLAVLHYVFVASPKYLDIYGTPKSLAGAAGDHRALRHVAQTFQRETWGQQATALEALATFSLDTNSSTALVAATVAGAGISTMPSFYCRLYPELEQIGPTISIPIQLWLVVHQEAQNTARVKRVVNWLRTMFDTKTNPWFRDEFVPPVQFTEELDAVQGRLAARPPRKP